MPGRMTPDRAGHGVVRRIDPTPWRRSSNDDECLQSFEHEPFSPRSEATKKRLRTLLSARTTGLPSGRQPPDLSIAPHLARSPDARSRYCGCGPKRPGRVASMRAALTSTVVLLATILTAGLPPWSPTRTHRLSRPLRGRRHDVGPDRAGGVRLRAEPRNLQASSATRSRRPRRSLRAFELLYEGSPLALRGGAEETIPKAPNPPGEGSSLRRRFPHRPVGRRDSEPDDRAEEHAVLLGANRHAPGRRSRHAGGPTGCRSGAGGAGVRAPGHPPRLGDVAHGTPNAALVFDESCPWIGPRCRAQPAERAEVWIDRVSEAVVRCSCDVDLEHVLWLQRQEYDASRPIAIPIDPRGTPGDRPLVIREGGPWGPAARALFDAIRIDPVRPHGTPVVIDVVSKGRSGIVPNRGAAPGRSSERRPRSRAILLRVNAR